VSVSSQQEEWAIATQEFLASPEGQNWDGSPNKLALMGWMLTVNGLADTEDKVSALKSVAAELHNRGLDIVPENKVEIRADASPAEILKAWKFGYGDDPARIGEAFQRFFT
jgi:hypothetical protein